MRALSAEQGGPSSSAATLDESPLARIGNGFIEDEEGQDVLDLAAARERAIHNLQNILAGEIATVVLRRASFIEIEDENHKLVMTVPFSEAVRGPSERPA